MGYNLRNRSYVKELDFTPDELKFLLKLSAELKAAKYGGYDDVGGRAGSHRRAARDHRALGQPRRLVEVGEGAAPGWERCRLTRRWFNPGPSLQPSPMVLDPEAATCGTS